LKILYQLFVFLYPKAAWFISWKNGKAKKWVRGRKDVFKSLSNYFYLQKKPVIWVHCASLGEFEQGRPIIESIKKEYPNFLILLTFFSPSGYEVRKNYPLADYISYLPMDSAKNATRFFNIVQPSFILFIKYEFWHYYCKEAAERKVPLLLASGIFREDQIFFKWYGEFYRNILQNFSQFFVQDEQSALLLQQLGLAEKTIVSGDTRFDRVLEIQAQFEPIQIIDTFCKEAITIVAGSTWTEDDEELDHFINEHPDIKCIIAPHEIEAERLQECQKLYKRSMLLSEYEQSMSREENPLNDPQVLIIDNYGMLTRLYHYAKICLVGGGFGGDGVHNVLEAAVYGKPVIIGPVYEKYIEAVDLVENGGCIAVENALELEEVLLQLLDPKNPYYQESAKAAKDYVHAHAGATNKILDHIQAKRLLTN
jgi:3-deoxy-D-manno-octulosonic-acid transferase